MMVQTVSDLSKDEWWTNDTIIDKVRRVFGGTIGLDPCTYIPSSERIKYK